MPGAGRGLRPVAPPLNQPLPLATGGSPSHCTSEPSLRMTPATQPPGVRIHLPLASRTAPVTIDNSSVAPSVDGNGFALPTFQTFLKSLITPHPAMPDSRPSFRTGNGNVAPPNGHQTDV